MKFVEMFPMGTTGTSDDGSSADENVPKKGAGWTGVGSPLQVGVGYTSRDYCDGQGLPSPGRCREQAVSVHDSLEEGHGEVCEVR